MTDAMPDYGEPWEMSKDAFDEPVIADRVLMPKAECYDDKEAQRIISCVNSCRGIPDPEEEIPIKSPTTGSMLNEMAAYLESRFVDVTIARHHQGLWTVRLSNQHFHVFCTHSQRLPDAIREALDYVREQQEKAALQPKREGE